MNPKDTITVDVPLFIRLLEYAREDAKTDMDLHNVAERAINLSTEGECLGMESYDSIVGESEKLDEQLTRMQKLAGLLTENEYNNIKAQSWYEGYSNKLKNTVSDFENFLKNTGYEI